VAGGSCSCTVTEMEPLYEQGTYRTMGTEVEFDGIDSGPYCVRGDQATLVFEDEVGTFRLELGR
jgi:hypothetical protein